MAYQALYRVWRSQRFDDIVGQKAITQTLKHAISQKKTSHAYLFTGPRGTGKTSAAKIFAKAINCHHSIDGEPCNKCETCLSITEGRHNDVIEIDAASNNGVEEIRDIREKVKYAPTQADYKVYIIDEVHMLSTGAFNALLKTLEEPPTNVIFILATTEPHKIPATIISRTQRFDFKRIDPKDMMEHMAYILKQMNVEFDPSALFVIARCAAGGMRDALSILDQTISFSQGKINIDDAVQVTGSLTTEMMDQYLNACFHGKTQTALEILTNLFHEGKEANRLLEDLLLYCRDLLMYQQAPAFLEQQGIEVTNDFKQLSKQTDTAEIYSAITILSDTQNEIKFTTHDQVYLEVSTVKLSQLGSYLTEHKQITDENLPKQTVENDAGIAMLTAQVGQLKQELNELKTQINSGNLSTENNNKVQNKSTHQNKSLYRVPKEQVYQILQSATKQNLIDTKSVWEDLLQKLSVTQRAMLKASEAVAASPEGLVIAFDYEIVCQRAGQDLELQHTVKLSLQQLIQYNPNLVFIPMDSWSELRRTFIQESRIQQAQTEQVDDDLELPIAQGGDLAEPSENEIVEQAASLFGADLIEVVDD